MSDKNLTTSFDSFIEEKYIPLDKKIKIGAGIGIFLLPIVLFYFVFFMPNSETIASLKTQEKTLKDEIDRADKAASHLGKHQQALAETEKQFEEMSTLLPKQKEIPDLLRNISDLGKNAGLDFLSFTPGGEIPKDFYAEIPVNISIRGPYHNIGFFLDQVSKLNRIVTVNNINLSNPHKEGGEMVLNSTCRLVTYRFTNKEVSTNKKK